MTMPPGALVPTDVLARTAAATAGLDLLMLFGSRARGDAHPGSDWDFGYVASDDMDMAGLLAALVRALGTDGVDLVDLNRAGGLLRIRAARDGRLVFERKAGLADAFRLEAARFWCDAEPVLRTAYEHVLTGLDR